MTERERERENKRERERARERAKQSRIVEGDKERDKAEKE